MNVRGIKRVGPAIGFRHRTPTLGYVFLRLTSDRFGSIPLKNSFSNDREKISAVIGCDARFKLGGYVENAMPRCKAS